MGKIIIKKPLKIVILGSPVDDAKCELCGKIDELRPYGPNGEKICFDCGMKDKERTFQQFSKQVCGIPLPEEQN